MLNPKDRTEQGCRIIIVSAPSGVDPADVLFAEGIEIRRDDELFAIETSGNAVVEVLTKVEPS